MIRLEPLAGQDLAALHELRRGEAHGHAVGRPSAPSSSRLGDVVVGVLVGRRVGLVGVVLVGGVASAAASS